MEANATICDWNGASALAGDTGFDIGDSPPSSKGGGAIYNRVQPGPQASDERNKQPSFSAAPGFFVFPSGYE
jgi:hypothetical protein